MRFCLRALLRAGHRLHCRQNAIGGRNLTITQSWADLRRLRTIVKAAGAGAMRYVQGPERGFPSGHFFFLREDANKIQCTFKRADVLTKEFVSASKSIALGHAIKNYLGRGPGLAAVIRAVVDGNLAPVGYTDRLRGITGYLFLSEDLRRYRPVENTVVPAEGFLNYREAAASLGVKPSVIRGLVRQGILRACSGYRNGVSKLIPAADVRRMCGEHVAVTALAARLGLNGNAFAHLVRKSGLPLTAVPVPEKGRGSALFVSAEVAAEIGHKLSPTSSPILPQRAAPGRRGHRRSEQQTTLADLLS